MRLRLTDILFGFMKNQSDADAAASKKERTLADVNESDTTSGKQPRVRRTVGLTEARLRARNKQSWLTSQKGWSDFFGRFTTSTKR
jgi:hypothetical protein